MCLPLRHSPWVRRLFVVAVLASLVQCGDDEIASVQPPAIQDGVHGAVQKGPFLGGMRVTVQELDAALVPTGTSFETATHNDLGEYRLESDLRSRYVEVIASGSYYNEVQGGIAPTITLRALADVTSDARINVNLLTTLERDRIRQLVRDQELSFTAAERQAQVEILDLVGGAPQELITADDLDATEPGETNAIFLAASLDLQGTGSGSTLAQWMSTLNAALLTGRAHTDSVIAAQLQRNASQLHLNEIRTGLQRRYANAGASVTLPPFESYAKRIVPVAVVSVFPAPGSERVGFTSTISVSFNQEMREETVTAATFAVESDAGPLLGRVTYSAANWSASFTPDLPLAPSTEFRVRISPEVTSLSGRTLETAKTWSFVTERLDLVSDLVAHYPFDGDGRDISGNGRDAQTIKTTPAPNRHREDGRALRVQQHLYSDPAVILMPNPFPFTAQPWTFSMWFMLDTTPVRTHTILLSNSNVRRADDMPLVVDANTHQLYGALEDNRYLYSSVAVANDTWYHATLVYAENRVRIYVNGTKKHDSASTFKTTYPETSAWAIGKETLDQRWWGQLVGVVDDVRIYARALNDIEIKALYDEPAP